MLATLSQTVVSLAMRALSSSIPLVCVYDLQILNAPSDSSYMLKSTASSQFSESSENRGNDELSELSIALEGM
jgi:hypothetical protein